MYNIMKEANISISPSNSTSYWQAQLHLQIDLPEKKIVSKALIKAVRPELSGRDPSNNKSYIQ
jgi:hypothetical protein